jgi:hypothetical protein
MSSGLFALSNWTNGGEIYCEIGKLVGRSGLGLSVKYKWFIGVTCMELLFCFLNIFLG